MKTLHTVLAAAVLATCATTAMAADEKVVTEDGVATFSFFKPASVRAEVGTLGYGGAVSYNVTPKVGLTLGYNGGNVSWSDGANLHGVDYDMDMKNNNIYLNAELRPFANAFYVAAGVGYIDAEYNVKETLTNTNDTIEINGQNFHAAGGSGSFTGKLNYDNTIAPYLGLGFSPATTSRFGMFGEVGVYYAGNPTANLTATGLTAVGGGTDGQTAADAEENKLNNSGRYEWLPVAKLGVTYRF